MLIQSEIPVNAGFQLLKPMYIFSTYLSEKASQQQTLQSFRNKIVYNSRTVVIRPWKNTFDATILHHTSLKKHVFKIGPTYKIFTNLNRTEKE